MRITVGFKVTPDYETLRDAEWAAAEGGELETRFAPRVLNCFDESALELALRLREQRAGQGAVTELGAVTVGGRDAEPYLATLLALGYGRAARVEPQAALDFDPGAVAAIIAAYVGDVGHSDLLLLGCRSGPVDSGAVPFLIAEALGWPCLSGVTALEPLADDRLRVTCAADDGLLQLTAQPPCVLAVGNAVVSRLRVPTLADRLAHKGRHADLLTPEQLAVDLSAGSAAGLWVMKDLRPIRRARPGTTVAGNTPAEKARALYDGPVGRLIETL